ncbi:MAG TPA: histone deacetylase [Polyangia bacterium]|nr:histone deacetylase [Polyangia bacterium]
MTTVKTGLCCDQRFRDHVSPPGHPERPDRLVAIERLLDEGGLRARCQPVAARPATQEELERVHDAAYLRSLEQRVGVKGASGWLDPDTYYSPGSWTAALLAAGAAVELAERVHRGELDNALGLVRPPGHHATRDRAMGFCLLNNVAVAAGALRARGARVAIVDFDVHHGNGTQDIFYDDPDVLYASTHQFPFYPGTGDVDERGTERGRGTTVNVPLPAGAGDAAYQRAIDDVIVPAIARFAPDVLLVSAGFDAHRRDPLASMNVTEAGYVAMTRSLLGLAGGKLVALLEGGYDLDALAASAAALLGVLLGDPAPPPHGATPPPPSAAALSAAEAAAIARAQKLHLG